MKPKLSVVGQLETWEAVGVVYSVCWTLVDMPLYVLSVVNGVIFAQFVEYPYLRMEIDFGFAFIMSA